MTYTWRDIIDDAYLQIGMERANTGEQLRRAMYCVALMQSEWDNRGFNIWRHLPYTLALTTGTASYTLPSDTITLSSVSVRDSNGTELLMEEISMERYQSIPVKTQTGKPTQYMVMRTVAGCTLYIWPVAPDSSSYTLTGFRYTTDASTLRVDSSPQIGSSMIPAAVAGLAYYLGKRNPQACSPAQLMQLKADYDEMWDRARASDAQNTDLHVYR